MKKCVGFFCPYLKKEMQTLKYTSVSNSAHFHNFLSHIVKIIHKKCFFHSKNEAPTLR